jgi:hypothetical protein
LAIEVALQNERGEVLVIVHDSRNLMPRLLERSMADEPFLAQIDWYGDTVFNRVQMPRFMSAWRALEQQAQTPEEAKLVNEIRELAERCESDLHPHLKFTWD